MKPRAAPAIWPYPHRTVAEVWGIKPRAATSAERPIFVRSMIPDNRRVLIDLTNAPSAMEQRFAGKRV